MYLDYEEEKMKRGMCLLLIFLLVVSSLTAAGKKDEASSPIVEVSVFATEESQQKLNLKVFSSLLEEYNSINGTSYQLKLVTGQSKDIINTRMSSNNKPDIFILDSPADVHQYAQDGLLLDLTKYAQSYRWEEVLFPWAFDLAKVQNRVMTLPYGYEGMVLWYNKQIMKQLGLEAESIIDLNSFENAMIRAKNAGYVPVMLGSQDWPWAQEWYLSILYSYTGRALVKNTVEGKNPNGWNDEAFKKTVELYKSWHQKGYLADGKSFVLTSDDAINAFTTDKALFKLEGSWAPYWIAPLDAKDQDKIGVMLHPAINDVEKPHLPLAVGGMWCASADTKHPDVVGFLISGLLRQDFQRDFLATGMDVAPMDIDDEMFSDLPPTIRAMWSMVNDALTNNSFGYTTWAFYPPETRVYLYEGIISVLENRLSVADYLAEMNRLNTLELQQGFEPVIPSAL
jgi:raffinose/stachyose/melibiose transport system substrate-binding protein